MEVRIVFQDVVHNKVIVHYMMTNANIYIMIIRIMIDIFLEVYQVMKDILHLLLLVLL